MSKFAMLLALAAAPLCAQKGEYAIVLSAPAAARQFPSKSQLHSAAGETARARIEAAQHMVREAVAARGLRVTGSDSVLVNAVFVRASRSQAEALSSLPGVARVEYLPPMRRHLDRAVDLQNVRNAWTAAGGAGRAGVGVRIGILDGGIDQNHPAFQQSCEAVAPLPSQPAEWSAYTNSKVIVARSYVAQLPFAEIDPVDSRPDDTSPRDRSGHGTAVAMIAAGGPVSGPSGGIQGIAPRACLGNYKIFGSPGVNDTTRASVIVKALNDALADKMDIVTLPVGSPALYGPLDSNCGDSGNAQCDVRAQAVETAVRAGLTVVVSAGNDGSAAYNYPALNSIHTPGTAPSAISVGASTNSHVFFSGVTVDGRRLLALFGDGPRPEPALTKPLRDVSQIGGQDGRACDPLPNGSLADAIALIQRGGCDFAFKVNYAQKAGAAGVVIYQSDGLDYPFSPLGLVETGIPAAMIGNRDGLDLKNLLAANPGKPVTLDPALQPVDAAYDTMALFSSRGPSTGENAIKPELVAVGTDIYTATQKYDPSGELYDPSGYTGVQGTSFAAPMVAGTLAMVKQLNAGFTPAQLKSAVVNTASRQVQEDGQPAGVMAVGGGKLDAGAAVSTAATIEPATLSFGVIGTGALPARSLKITNTSRITASYGIDIVPSQRDIRATLTPSTRLLSLNPGQTSTITITMAGQRPDPGAYEGYISIGNSYRVPFLYLVGDGVPANAIPLAGDGFEGVVGEQGWLMAFKVVDKYGVAVQNAPVQFSVGTGGGSIQLADASTDIIGIAAAQVTLGSQLGAQSFSVKVTGTDLAVDFVGRARQLPAINTNGVVNAASFLVGPGVAPGSYATIQGADLSDSLRVFTTSYLPVSLAGVSVSFDAPGSKLSLPGHLHFVSERQINVQVPWEFQGLNSVQMKVSVGEVQSKVYTVPLSDYAPGVFEFDDVSGRRLSAAIDTQGQVVTVANPVSRGAAISLYVNGLGPVDNQPASGEPTPADRFSRTRATVGVTVGGKRADVSFSGLSPFYVGLYQVNLVIPGDITPGVQPVVVSVNGVDSKTASIPVQ